ncbi:MAG: SCO family protein, partial [Bacteroidota bacterium]
MHKIPSAILLPVKIAQVVLLVFTSAIFGCTSSPNEFASRVDQLPYYNEATFTPVWFDSQDEVPGDFHQIPSFSLLNQSGDLITEKDLEGKIFVTDFFFTTCPGICSRMTSNMLLIQEAFLEDEDVLLLSHSVTPEYDSVAILRSYAEIKGVVDSKWHLLTGDRREIYDLGRNQYFVEEDLGLEKNPEDFIHTENFVLIDGSRHIRGIYNGLNKTAVNQLIADI